MIYQLTAYWMCLSLAISEQLFVYPFNTRALAPVLKPFQNHYSWTVHAIYLIPAGSDTEKSLFFPQNQKIQINCVTSWKVKICQRACYLGVAGEISGVKGIARYLMVTWLNSLVVVTFLFKFTLIGHVFGLPLISIYSTHLTPTSKKKKIHSSLWLFSDN